MLKIVNVNIYDIIGVSFDPVYMALQQLRSNEEILIDKYTIRKQINFMKLKMETYMNTLEKKRSAINF